MKIPWLVKIPWLGPWCSRASGLGRGRVSARDSGILLWVGGGAREGEEAAILPLPTLGRGGARGYPGGEPLDPCGRRREPAWRTR